MKAHGNGKKETCASNLLRIVRGEVPLDRVRGRDGTLVDAANITDEAIADAEWVLETYEPRVDVQGIANDPEGAASGDFCMIAEITQRKEEKEWAN